MFQTPQLYRWEHVVTVDELIGIYDGYKLQRSRLPRWQWIDRYKLLIAMGVTANIIGWIEQGKLVTEEK